MSRLNALNMSCEANRQRRAMGQASMTEPDGGFSSDGLKEMFSKLSSTSHSVWKTSFGTRRRGSVNLATYFSVLVFVMAFFDPQAPGFIATHI